MNIWEILKAGEFLFILLIILMIIMNHFQVNMDQETALDGFYAAGDITGGKVKQAIVSAGDGARAGYF